MSTGTNAGSSGCACTSCQGMLLTKSSVSARGCSSYHASTSLSVSNTLRSSPYAGKLLLLSRQNYATPRVCGFRAREHKSPVCGVDVLDLLDVDYDARRVPTAPAGGPSSGAAECEAYMKQHAETIPSRGGRGAASLYDRFADLYDI